MTSMIDTIDVQPHPGITAEDGFMTAYERQVLATLVRNENVRSVLEIGINEGKTAAVVLAANSVIERYVGVELQWGSQPTLPQQRVEATNNPGWVVRGDGRFRIIVKPRGSLDLTAAHFTESFDLILIDGDHSEQAVAHDTDMAYKLINRPGVIVWHDYEPQCPVYEYVNKLAHNGVHLGIRKITDTRFAYCKCV